MTTWKLVSTSSSSAGCNPRSAARTKSRCRCDCQVCDKSPPPTGPGRDRSSTIGTSPAPSCPAPPRAGLGPARAAAAALQLAGPDLDFSVRQLGQPGAEDIHQLPATVIRGLDVPHLRELTQRAGDQERLGVLVRRVGVDVALDGSPILQAQQASARSAGATRSASSAALPPGRSPAPARSPAVSGRPPRAARAVAHGEQRQQVDAVPGVRPGVLLVGAAVGGDRLLEGLPRA